MDIEFYRNFLAVARAGSLTAAAKTLSVAQPALSAQIRKLEEYCGARLIRTGRGQRHLVLTEAGRAFAEKAARLCGIEDEMLLDMTSFGGKAQGTVRLGVSPLKAGWFLARYVIPFSKAYPRMTFQFHSETVRRQIGHVRSGAIDLAFANAPLPSEEGLSVRRAGREYFYFISPEKRGVTAVEDLAERPFCCTYGCSGLIRKICREKGFAPEIPFIANTADMALAYAAGTGSAAVLAMEEEEWLPQGLFRRRMDEDGFYMEETLFWNAREPLPPAAAAFLSFAEAQGIFPAFPEKKKLLDNSITSLYNAIHTSQ